MLASTLKNGYKCSLIRFYTFFRKVKSVSKEIDKRFSIGLQTFFTKAERPKERPPFQDRNRVRGGVCAL